MRFRSYAVEISFRPTSNENLLLCDVILLILKFGYKIGLTCLNSDYHWIGCMCNIGLN